MKKQTAIFACALLTIGMQLKSQSWSIGGDNLGATGLLGSKAGYSQDVQFITNGNPVMTLKASTSFLGVGINPANFMLDVGQDINAGGSTSGTVSGYWLGGNKILFHGGVTSNIFVGVLAGNSNTGTNNTGIGSYALNAATGGSNTAIGFDALYLSSSAAYNTAVGAYSLGGAINTGNNNTAVGYSSLYSNTSGTQNAALGFEALYYNVGGTKNTATGDLALYRNLSGSDNTANGSNALQGLANSTGSENTALGSASMLTNFSGSDNTAVGFNSLQGNYSGNENTAIGQGALYKNYDGLGNTGTGFQVLFQNLHGNYNTATGYQALDNNTVSYNCAFGYKTLRANTTGFPNSAFGTNSLAACTSGANNSAFGYNSLYTVITGSNNVAYGDYSLTSNTASRNTAIGYNAAANLISGTDNTFLGYNANTGGVNQGTLVKSCAIGSGATVTTSSTMILGDNTINVGIGYSGTSLTANTKFDVLTTGSTISGGNNSYASHFVNSNTANGSFGIPPSYAYTYGVWGESTGAGNAYGYNYGGSFKASNGTNCVGVGGTTVAPSTASLAYGGYFNSSFAASSTGTSHAVTALTTGNGAVNIAVYANAPSSSNNTLQNWAGQFVGDVYVTGNGWIAAAWNIISDRKYKTNIDTIQNPLDILKKLKPKIYNYDTANADGISFPYEKQYGFIAQDLQQVLPELVKTVKKPVELDSAGKMVHKAVSHLGVNYNSFIALLAAAMQAQQGKIDSLTQKGDKQESLLQKQDSLISKQDSINKALQDQINQIVNNCCSKGAQSRAAESNDNGKGDNKTISTINVELSNLDVIILNEAAPNPFAEQTLITFNIPEKYNVAQMLFYDSNGKLIKSVEILKKGKGQMYVFGTDLTNGTYSYSLIVDGKIIDTKKMIKQQ